MVVVDLTELRGASDALRKLDERRKGQAEYRDWLVQELLRDGATWVQVMDASGLSRRSVQLIARRSR